MYQTTVDWIRANPCMYPIYLMNTHLHCLLPALLLQNINVATFSFKTYFIAVYHSQCWCIIPKYFGQWWRNIKYTFSSNFHFLKRKVNWLIKFWHWLEILDVATLMSSHQNGIYNTTYSYIQNYSCANTFILNWMIH